MSILSFVKPLAYITLPIFVLRSASRSSPVARYYVRIGIYLSAMGICSVWGVLASIGMTLIGRRLDINWLVARSFYAIASRWLDITIEVEGEEYLSTRPAVLVGNHQSMLDILFLGRFMPKQASMTAKKELKWMPFLGQFMALSGAVFIDRKNNASAIRSVAEAGRTMKERKTSIFVYPEGTRTLSEKPELKPFKKGAFHLAVQSGIPITPIVTENYWRIYRKGVFGNGKVKVKVLPPVSTVGLSSSDVTELAASVREQMLKTLTEISGGSDVPESETTVAEESVSQIEPERVQEEAPPKPSSETHTDSGPEDAPLTAALAVDTSSIRARRNGSSSERGPETESDDGVLVDRPDTPSA